MFVKLTLKINERKKKKNFLKRSRNETRNSLYVRQCKLILDRHAQVINNQLATCFVYRVISEKRSFHLHTTQFQLIQFENLSGCIVLSVNYGIRLAS